MKDGLKSTIHDKKVCHLFEEKKDPLPRPDQKDGWKLINITMHDCQKY